MEEKKELQKTGSTEVKETTAQEAAEAKAPETTETTTADAKAADTKAADTKATDTKAADTKTADTKTAEANATEAKKPKTFAERMVAYRASHCLTQKQMGELMHLSANHIGVLERGLKKPRPATKAKFLELSGKREIRPLGDSRPMSQKEIDVYQELLDGLGKLSVKRRIEVLAVYRYILKWFI